MNGVVRYSETKYLWSLAIARRSCLLRCLRRFLVVFLFIAFILLCHRFHHPLSLIAGSDLYPTQTTPYPSIDRVVSWVSQVGQSRLEASLGHSSTLPSREIYPQKQDPFQGPLVKPTFRGLGGFRADSPLAKWQVLKGKRTPVETPGFLGQSNWRPFGPGVLKVENYRTLAALLPSTGFKPSATTSPRTLLSIGSGNRSVNLIIGQHLW